MFYYEFYWFYNIGHINKHFSLQNLLLVYWYAKMYTYLIKEISDHYYKRYNWHKKTVIRFMNKD